MKKRCYNKNEENYKHYGGRGIKVCDRWLNSFENFRDDMYESYLKHIEEFGEKETTLERIDVNGNYCPENCTFKTWEEQVNNMRSNVLLTFNGETKSRKEWAKISGINYRCLISRLDRSWSIEKTLTTPVKKITKNS